MICTACRRALRGAFPLSTIHMATAARQTSSLVSSSLVQGHRLAQSRRSLATTRILSSSLARDQEQSMSEAEASIASILTTKLSPTAVLVQDVSGGCGSMYAIDITSEKFRGLNILKQQRMVNAALGDLVGTWHGVQIRTSVPETASSS